MQAFYLAFLFLITTTNAYGTDRDLGKSKLSLNQIGHEADELSLKAKLYPTQREYPEVVPEHEVQCLVEAFGWPQPLMAGQVIAMPITLIITFYRSHALHEVAANYRVIVINRYKHPIAAITPYELEVIQNPLFIGRARDLIRVPMTNAVSYLGRDIAQAQERDQPYLVMYRDAPYVVVRPLK